MFHFQTNHVSKKRFCDTILPLSQKDTCENLNLLLFLFTDTLFSIELCQEIMLSKEFDCGLCVLRSKTFSELSKYRL